MENDNGQKWSRFFQSSRNFLFKSRLFFTRRDFSIQVEIYRLNWRFVFHVGMFQLKSTFFNSRRGSRCYPRFVFGIFCQRQKSQDDVAVSSFVIILYSCFVSICFDSIHWWQHEETSRLSVRHARLYKYTIELSIVYMIDWKAISN